MKTPVEVTYTVQELPQSRFGGIEEATSYVVTASAKATTKSGSSNNSHVNLSASLTMHWTDVTGLRNTIDRLAGSYRLESGTISSQNIQWGGNTNGTGSTRNIPVNSTSFNESINFETQNRLGIISANYMIHYNNNTQSLRIQVTPTVFD